MAIFYTLSFFATIGATFLGSIISLLAKKFPKGIIIFLQNFSTGALLAFLFLELFSESISSFVSFLDGNEIYGALSSLSIILGSGLLFYLLHILVDKLSNHHHEDEHGCTDHMHAEELLERSKERSLFISALVFFIAIFTHNIPEGFSLGLSFADVNHLENGYIMSLILFIHNIIIAYAMSSSLKDSKLKNVYIVLLTLLSSLPAYVFAIVGYHLGDLLFSNLLAKAILLAISAGSLMFILAKELLPPLFTTYKSKLTPIYLLLGVCVFACLLFIHVH